MNKEITVRYPPSPTGEIHIGNIRTLLFNYLFARQNGGKAVLRFEDTDTERSDRSFEQYTIEALDILAITYDDGPYRQSERTERYEEALGQMIDSGHAYVAEETENGEGNVVRFKNPNKQITFNDTIRGEITIDTTDFGDFVIARSLENPLYHLTVVVDDIDMGISHVIRGEDHITSTPRQILLFEALGAVLPVFAHLPMIVGADKKKLSKRHGAVTVQSFIEQGYLPQGIVNYLALLGWHPSDEREAFSMQDLIQEFDLERVGKNPAMFDYKKLDDINRHWVLQLSDDEYERNVSAFLSEEMRVRMNAEPVKARLIRDLILRERIAKFSDVQTLEQEGELVYLFERPKINWDLINFKDTDHAIIKENVTSVIQKLRAMTEWELVGIKDAIFDWSGTVEGGRGAVLHPMRTALSGAKRSPDPFSLATILGKGETIARLETVLSL